MTSRRLATVCQGDSLTTGPGATEELRLRRRRWATPRRRTTITDLRLARRSDRFGLSSGSVWGVAVARRPPRPVRRRARHERLPAAPSASAARPSTASRASSASPVVLHAIEGRGSPADGHQRIHFLAGYTAIASTNSVRLLDALARPQRSARTGGGASAVDHSGSALVNPGRIAGRLALGLDRAARVVVRVFFANHRWPMLVTHARGGLNVLRPIHHRLAPRRVHRRRQASRGGRVTRPPGVSIGSTSRMGRPRHATEAQRRKLRSAARLRQPQSGSRPSDGRTARTSPRARVVRVPEGKRGVLPSSSPRPGCAARPGFTALGRVRIPGEATGLPEGGGDVTEGENSFGNTGYNGPSAAARARPAPLLLLGLRPRPGPRAAPGLDRDRPPAPDRGRTSSSRRASSARTATRADDARDLPRRVALDRVSRTDPCRGQLLLHRAGARS